MKIFLFDIEGTTTDIHFVHQVLFPYAYKNLETFILNNQSNQVVQKVLRDTFETLRSEQSRSASLYELISFLKLCINCDRKYPPLKILQGLIWDVGYHHQEFQGHVYPDVLPFWQKIKEEGHEIAIYSSGSIQAQKLIFKFSTLGDLTSYIKNYFDTTVGHKREPQSYKKIAHELKTHPGDITFFSDMREELIAAKTAGMQTGELRRDQIKNSEFKVIDSFASWDNEH